jgi:hypothetical protein
MGGRGSGWLSRRVLRREISTRLEWLHGAHVGNEAKQSVGGIFSSTTAHKLQKTYELSGWAPIYGLRGRSIRKKIIGHGMRSVAPGLGFGKRFRSTRRPVALLQEQARQHGGGVFFQPLIQQGADLLAEIGSMRQARQFKALQGVPRRREKELPRWLGRAGGQRTSVKERAAY